MNPVDVRSHANELTFFVFLRLGVWAQRMWLI